MGKKIMNTVLFLVIYLAGLFGGMFRVDSIG